MKRCFLTGGTGFIGTAVTRLLAAEGVDIGLFVRDRSKALSLFGSHKLTFFEGDLHDTRSLSRAVMIYKPDTVIHLGWAGINGTQRDDPVQLSNQRATIELARTAIHANVNTFIGLGSQAEYGPKQGVVFESDTCTPACLYGASKLASQCLTQQLCRISGIRYAWIRLFSCYGPHDTPTFVIPTVIEALLDGKRPALTSAEQRWDFLHVDDAARAIVIIAKLSDHSEETQGIFNLGSGYTTPLKSIIEQLRDLIDDRLPLGFGEVPYSSHQIMHLEADVSRLRNIGWSPAITLQQGLVTTVKWHRTKREV